LASFLGKGKAQGHILFIFDEPTTGLHFHDIRKLLASFNALIEQGHSIIVIEHNTDVIRSADWVIDLGPEAGDGGGTVVFAGTPEDVVQQWKAGAPSHTAAILAGVLEAGPHAERPKFDPFAAERPREDDVALEGVGKDAAMPW